MNRAVLLALCILLGVALTLVYNRRPVVVPGNDAGAYMAMGVGMAGQGPTIYSKFPWPPLYPFAGSLLLRLGLGPLLAFHLVCLGAFVLLIPVLSKVCATLELGLAPVLVTVCCPAVFAYGWTELSEMPFMLLASLALWTFLQLEDPKLALLPALLVTLSYETRYIGLFLLPVLFLIVLLNYLRGAAFKGKALAAVLGAAGIFAAHVFDVWLYDLPVSHPVFSWSALPGTIRDLGTALWALWVGDGPVAKLPHPLLWLLALPSLAALGYLLICSLRNEPRVRGLALAVGGYLSLLIVAECSLSIDAIARRFMAPIVPVLIILAFHRLRGCPQWVIRSLVIAAALVACVHVVKGRLYS